MTTTKTTMHIISHKKDITHKTSYKYPENIRILTLSDLNNMSTKESFLIFILLDLIA